jgi:hypothetical protein
MAQGGDEGLGAPVTEGGLHLQPPASTRAASEPGHLGGRAGLTAFAVSFASVDKHQPFRAFLHPRLAMRRPYPPPPDDVSAIGFARQQRFF